MKGHIIKPQIQCNKAQFYLRDAVEKSLKLCFVICTVTRPSQWPCSCGHSRLMHQILETNQCWACFKLGITLCDTAAYQSLYTHHEVHTKPATKKPLLKERHMYMFPSKSQQTHHFKGDRAMRW